MESRLAEAESFDGTVNIAYDAFGRMAEQVSATNTQILYSPTGDKVALMNGQSLRNAFISLPGGGQAVYAATGTLSYYRHPDWLGSSRLATTSTQTVYYDGAYAPFGENYNESGTPDRFFTGQTQGTAYGIYDFLFRQQNPVHGRWLVPDPAGLAAVDPTNPQTWNRYAYVANDPLNRVDPLGLFWYLICSRTGIDGGYVCYPVFFADGPPDGRSGGRHVDVIVSIKPKKTVKSPNKQPLKPGCGSAIGETAIGVVGTAAEGAAIYFFGPEFLAVAGEGVAETIATEGILAGGSEIAHIGTAILPVLAAPVALAAHGFTNIASDCF